MGISLHIAKSVAPVVWKVVSQENIISIIIIIISCSDHSITYNQFDLKLMKRSLCLSSRLMDHRTTEGELLVQKENQLVNKERCSWLVAMTGVIVTLRFKKLYQSPRLFSGKSRTRDRGRKIPPS